MIASPVTHRTYFLSWWRARRCDRKYSASKQVYRGREIRPQGPSYQRPQPHSSYDDTHVPSVALALTVRWGRWVIPCTLKFSNFCVGGVLLTSNEPLNNVTVSAALFGWPMVSRVKRYADIHVKMNDMNPFQLYANDLSCLVWCPQNCQGSLPAGRWSHCWHASGLATAAAREPTPRVTISMNLTVYSSVGPFNSQCRHARIPTPIHWYQHQINVTCHWSVHRGTTDACPRKRRWTFQR